MEIKTIRLSLLLVTAGCAISQSPDFAKVPATLDPGAGEKLAFVVPARGDQIYECRELAGKPGDKPFFGWAFVAPDAVLYDIAGKKIGRHYAGPNWESDDGSKVSGAIRQRADAATPKDVPWLLLATKSVGGKGSFSDVTNIQRVHTVGGTAPAGGCEQAGHKVRVPYTAEYNFFISK